MARALGQKVKLIPRIQNILQNYLEGVGIVKELIQNADDAGATKVVLTLDWRTHSSTLPDHSMKALMGPSMLVYNDKWFAEADFEGIQNIDQGSTEEILWQTGKFGLGFNSVYHVTDYPSFISRDRLVFFDPLCTAKPPQKTIPWATPSEPGAEIYYAQEDWWALYPDFLQMYVAGGLQELTNDFMGTVFRLPLRQKKSQLSNQAFTRSRFDELVDKLQQLGEQLLIFTKSVYELCIREIDESGIVQERLHVLTENPKLVEDSRQQIRAVLEGSYKELLQKFREEPDSLPQVSYLHQFKVISETSVFRSTWRICNLIRIDDEGFLERAIQDMLEIEQQVIPWAGAAARIHVSSENSDFQFKPIEGLAYCFLPLPIETGLPIHINASFDINSDRRDLTTDSSTTGGGSAKVQWNQKLINHVVAYACADLIDCLVKDIGKSDADAFYKLWPINSQLKAFNSLASSFIHAVKQSCVIRSNLSEEWVKPTDIYILEQAANHLFHPLTADNIRLPNPELPDSLLKSFEEAGVSLELISPQGLRGYFQKVNSELGCPLSQAPKASLRNKEWVLNLLRYCISDSHRDLRGLPLAVLEDGTLQRFGFNPPGFIYLVPVNEEEILKNQIFQDYPYWFLDTDFAHYAGISSVYEGVTMLTPVEVAKRLKDLVNLEDDITIRWEPDGKKIPNETWLTQVYSYFVDVKTLPVSELREVPLVPCNDGLLYVGGNVVTPLWWESSTSRETLDTLQYFGIPLVEAKNSLKLVIKRFLSQHTDPNKQLIFRLTVPDLIDTLEAQENLPVYNSELYKGLVSFLVDRNWMRGKGKNDDDRKQKLRQLQIYPTVEDQPTDLKNVYIPGDYIPPKVAGSLKLLCLGPSESSQEWRAFYDDFLSVSVLDHVTMIHNLLKDYASFQAIQQLEALEWIRDHLSIAQTELEKRSQSFDLKERVRELPLIRCTDGHLRPANAIYNPKTYNQVRQVLGDRAHTPDMTIYKNVEHWLDFFQELRMLVTPSASDLLAYVDGQIQQAQNGITSEIAQHLAAIFSHIEEHWDRLGNENVASGKSLAEALKMRAWLPVQRDPERLKRFSAFTVPQNKLYHSSEVYFSPYGSLVASQKPLFPVGKLPSREFQTALGFSTYPDQQSVVNHFKTLIDLWSETCGDGIDNEAFHKSVQNIYGYFHNAFCGTSSSEKGQQRLRDQLDGYECLWDYGRFWLPEHTFQKKVPFFGKRRQKILIDKPQIRQVYELLGQKKSPDISDYIAFLEEVAADSKENPLSEDDGKCVCEVLKLLTQDLETEQCFAADYDLLLLTDDNLLLPPDQILIPDAPWRLDAIVGRDQVKILHPEVPHSLAIDAGSRSLLNDVIEIPKSIEPSSDQDASKLCQKWRKLLRSLEFIQGLERLIVDQHGLDNAVELSWLLKAEVKAAAAIVTKLQLDGSDIGAGLQGSYYFELNKCVFYICHEGEELMRHHLTESLNHQLGDFKLNDTARLLTMLNSKPSDIERLLDRLKVKVLKRSPLVTTSFEETDEDEVDEIFDGDFLDEFATDDADEGITSNNNGREPVSSAPTSTANGHTPGQAITNPSNGSVSQPPIPKPAPTPSTANSSPAVSSPVLPTLTQPSANPIIKPAKPTPSAPQRRGILDVKSAAQSTDQDDFEGVDQNDSEERDRQPASVSSPSTRNNVIRLRRVGGARRSRSAGKRRSQPRTTYSSQQYRNGVRVRSGLEVDPNKNAETELTESEARKIDQAGMARVMEYERRHGRDPQDMNEIDPNHPGYDVKSTDQRSGEVRYIEVKSLRAVWDRRGVCMTLKQFETGNKKQDNFWLYVVEQAESDEAKVTPIQNPVGLVGEFYYDDSWRQLADDEANKEG